MERVFSAGEGAFFQALRPPFQAPPKPLYTIPLAKLLDNGHQTTTTFMAGTTTVHLFGDQSDNKGGWFLGLAPEGGSPQYLNALKMVQVLGVGGSTRFEIDGKKFSARLQANLVHLLQSHLVIKTDDAAAAKVVSYTAGDISEAAYLAGYPLSIAGKYYRLLYSRKFDEGADGRFKGFIAKRAIVLMFRENGGFAGYYFTESDIPTDKPVFSTPSYANSDGKQVKGTLTFGLRLTPAKELEIHLPP